MSIIYINPFQFAAAAYDADAQDYIDRVIAADVAAGNTSGLEVGVQDAYNTFFVGCKADGNFSALKASCILAGARTRAGSLVPLLSSMPTPTSFNFVDADYNRKTGLKGNGSTKYLDSNRNNITDPQNDRHLACFVNTSQTSGAGAYIGAGAGDAGSSVIGSDVNLNTLFFRLSTGASSTVAGKAAATGFIGSNRSTASEYIVSIENTQTTFASSSEPPFAVNLFLFRRNSGAAIYSDARLAFYSIGESLDLALLDARVSTLMSDLAAAIP
jgi:hypothetical protein